MLFRLLGTVLLLNLLVASAEAAIPTPIIKVDASTLTPGPVTSFANLGSQSGTFDAIGQQTPVVETVAGKKAITFNGMNAYRASFTSPDALTGSNAWTVSTWIYNPTISSDSDFYFQWARRASSGEGDGHTASLVYNTQGVWGAADHYGNFAMNFGRLGAPTAAQWHNITITYDGANAVTGGSPVGTGTEIVYVDGVVVNVTIAKPLSLFTGTQMLLGSQELAFYAANTVQTPNNQNYTGLTGSIASLQMFSGALSPDDVATLAGGATLQTGTVTDLIMNNSFENYTYGGRDRNSLDLGGYWYGFSYQGVDFYGTSTSNPNYATSGRTGTVGNQYTRQTKFPMLKPDGDHWNNGDNFDGYHVLAMEATYPTKSYVSQALFGIKPNTDYKVWGYFNARQVNAAVQNLELKIDGADILSPSPMQITAVDGTKNTRVNPFTRVEANWHSNASLSHWISIGSIGVQGNTYNGIACDKICIAEVGGPSKPVLSVKDLPKLTQLDFFGVAAGASATKSFKLVNDGGSAMQVISTNIIGADGYNYSATPASNTVAAFGGMTDISVTFSPTASGTFNNAQLEIKTNSTVTPIILLPLTGFSVPTVANGSFEQIYQNTGGGDVQASYPGWISNVLGSNDGNQQIGFTYNGQWKLDNGNLVDGRQGAELVRNTNDGTTTSMSQVIPGFVKGRTYRFRFYANSFKGTTSNAYDGKVWSDFKVNGASARAVTKTPSSGTGSVVDFPGWITNLEAGGTRSKAYDKYEFDWTAPDNGAYPIEFDAVGSAAGDNNNALLLDNVGIFDKAVAGPATVSTTKLDFGNRTFNTTATLNVTVYNAGGKDLKVTTATTISGGQAGAFALGTTLPLNVPYGGSASVTVKFLNTSYGQQDSTLTLTTDIGTKFIIALTANTSFSAYYPVVTNGSFDDTIANKPTDVNNNDNANGKWSVPGSSKSGRSWSGSLYNNNGVDPDGKAAMWIRKGTGTDDTTYTIYQDVSGFRAGRTYRVSLFANASANYAGFNGIAASALPVSGQAHLVVALSKTDNTSPVNLVDTTVNAVNAANVFTTNWPSFTADYTVPANFNGTLRLAIRAGKSSGDDALLFDGVKVQEVAPGIQVAPTSVRFNTVNWYKNDKPSTATITITNAGLNALNLTGGATGYPGLTVVDNQFYNAPQFAFVSISPAGKTSLAPGESVSAVVKFNPTKKGNYTSSALLRVTSNDPNLPTVDIPLLGDAVPVELSTFSAE